MTALQRIKFYFSEISIDCWAVCLYLVFLPGTIVETPIGSLLKAVTIPVILVLFYKLLFGKSKPIRFNTIQAVYLLYTVYTVWELLILNTETSQTMTKDMVLTCAAIILMSMRVYNSYERDLMEKTWIAVGILSLYFGLFSSQEVFGEGRTAVYILGYPEDPNQFCGYFIMPIMIYIKRILNRSKLTPLYILLLLFTLYAVLKTGSRGGLIGILAGIVVFILLGIKSLKGKIALIVMGALCALFVVSVVFPLLPQDVQERYSVERVAEDKGSGRFDIWRYLIEYTTEKPERIIHGGGLYSTADTLKNSGLGLSARWAHNQFVQVFADQGMVGLMLFTLFAALCFFRNIRKNPEFACAFAAVMALSFSLTFYVFKPYINIVIMCAMTFETQKRKEIADETLNAAAV